MFIGSRYETVRKLGFGASGTVWLARDLLRDGESVAVKVLDQPGASASERFGNEYRLLSLLRHPNIVGVREYGLDRAMERPFVVLDYVEGRDFLQALASVPAERLLGTLRQVCSALDFVHKRGFLHADLKPSHIIVGPHGRAVLVDLGLARVIGEGRGLPPAGTLPYTAPEILQGSSADGRADLYALGVMLFRLLEGRLPFDGPTPSHVLAAHLSPERPILARAASGEHAWLAPTVHRLLALDPAHRPGTAGDLVAEWERALGLEPSPAEELALPYIVSLPLVGRKDAWGTITASLQALSRGTPPGQQVLTLIEGEKGIGKTRLLSEARDAARLAGIFVAQGHPPREGQGPYGAWLDLIRELAPAAALSAPAVRTLHHDFLSLISSASSVPGEAADLAIEFPRFLREVSCEMPLLLIIDDLHEADPHSLRLLETVCREVEGHPVLALAASETPVPANTAVPKPLARLAQERRLGRIVLERLAPADVRALLEEGLGIESEPEGLVTALHHQSAGNPLFLQAALESMAQDGTLRLERGHWTLPPAEAVLAAVPVSVEQALSRRLEALPPRVLGDARLLAVGGEAVPIVAARALLDAAPEDLQERLASLSRATILAPLERTPGRVEFDHPEIQRLLYLALEEGPRRASHLAAARAYAAADEEAWAEEIAHHALLSGEADLALEACRRAAARASRLQAPDAAARHLREALSRLPPGSPERAGMMLDLSTNLIQAGDYDAALAVLAELEADPARPDRLIPAILSKKARALIMRHPGSPEGLMEAEKAAARAIELGDLPTAGLATKDGAIALARQGRYREALSRFQEALRLSEHNPDERVRVDLLNSLGLSHLFVGEFPQAEARLKEAQGLAFKIGYRKMLAASFNNLSIVHGRTGRREAFLEAAASAVRLIEYVGNSRSKGDALCNLAIAQQTLGRYAEALRNQARAQDAFRKGGDRGREAYSLDNQGDMLRLCGRLEDALRSHGEALRIAEADEDTVQQVFACAALAQDRLAGGDTAGARAHAERAVLLSDALETLRPRARAILALAEVDLEAGNAGRAEASAERLLKLADHSGTLDEMEPEADLLLARARLARGDFRAAAAAIDHALARIEALKLLEPRAQVLRLKASLLQSEGRPSAARNAQADAARVIRHIASQIGDESLTRDYVSVPWRAALLDSAAAATQAPESEESAERRLEGLYEIVSAINSVLDPEPLLEKVMDTAISIVKAERGLLILIDHATGAMEVKVARGVDRTTIADATRYSRGIVREAGQGRSILALDAEQDGRFQDFRSVSLLHLKSLMCVPLRLRGQIIGTVYLDSSLSEQRFTEEDLRFLEAFAHHAAIAIENARHHAELIQENQILRRASQERYSFGNLLGKSEPMRRLFAVLERAADSNLPVLIEGESGTGKELVARGLHFNGARGQGPFVSQNCSAIPEPLLESELFGHARGAFTGADRDRKGLFELAHRGTLFLDEIGDLPLGMQPKLLRALEEGEIRPLGSRRPFRVDVRVISATNRQLQSLLASGRFREDLYYRLNVLKITIPPLRDRRDDIQLLAEHFLKAAAQEKGLERLDLDPDLLSLFLRHDWPGNVRELENVIQRLALMARGARITRRDMESDPELCQCFASLIEGVAVDSLRELQRRQIHRALDKTGGNREQAARLLGISRATIFRKIKEFQLD